MCVSRLLTPYGMGEDLNDLNEIAPIQVSSDV
jgi:hypothetical protein